MNDVTASSLSAISGSTLPANGFVANGLVEAGGRRELGEPISFVGALLMSAAVVVVAVTGLCVLAALLTGLWWGVSHIPVPAAVTHLLALLGLG